MLGAIGKNTNLPDPLLHPAGRTLPAGNFPAHFQDAPHTVRGKSIAPIDSVHCALSNRFSASNVAPFRPWYGPVKLGPKLSAAKLAPFRPRYGPVKLVPVAGGVLPANYGAQTSRDRIMVDPAPILPRKKRIESARRALLI